MHRAVLLSVGAEIEEFAIRLPDGQPLAAGRSGRRAWPRPRARRRPTPSPRTFVGQTVAEVEQHLIIDTLEHCLGNRTHAANILGISIRTLRNKLKEYSEAGVSVPAAAGWARRRGLTRPFRAARATSCRGRADRRWR